MIYDKTKDSLILQEVSEVEARYTDTPIMILDRLPFYQFRTLRMVEYYSNSKYLRGATYSPEGSWETANIDSLGREKPFYNIVNFRVTLAKVATDLDIKDITITSDEPKDWVRAMFLQHEVYEWMKEADFDYFLNKSGQTRAKYGGVIAKKCFEKEDGKEELEIEVVDWRNIITDQVDILGGTIIERHFMTPVELSKKKDVWDNVQEAIELATTKLNKKRGYQQEEYNSERIEVKEVHGEFPIAFLKSAKGESYDNADKFDFVRQKYFLTETNGKCIIFYAEEETEEEFPYKYLPWEEMPGRGLGRGVVEDSEEAQVWTNDAVINEKNAMDLAGKVVLKSNSKKVGNNILDVDNGKIFELDEGKDLVAMQLAPTALGEFQNQINKWQSQADRATSSFDANTGEQPPSGTPYSQTALLNQVASKPFDYRREEMGIFIAEIFEDWVLPFLIKKLYKSHMLVSDFSEEELDAIDSSFAVYEANQVVIDNAIKGQTMTQEQYNALVEAKKLILKGTKRFIEIPDGYFDDINSKVTIITTGEQKNKAAVLQSLSTIMQTVMASRNPNTGKFDALEDPTLSKVFGTILELSGAGISPASLGLGKTSMTQQQAPQQNPIQQAPTALPPLPNSPVATQ